MLADRTALWSSRPQNRQLPSFLQWLQIRLLTTKRNWAPPERRMMGKATRHHGVRGLVAAALLALLAWGAYEAYGTLKAQGLRDRLLSANILDVPAIVADMDPYRRWLDPLLREAHRKAQEKQDPRGLHVSLALVPVDPAQLGYLYRRLLVGEAREVI